MVQWWWFISFTTTGILISWENTLCLHWNNYICGSTMSSAWLLAWTFVCKHTVGYLSSSWLECECAYSVNMALGFVNVRPFCNSHSLTAFAVPFILQHGDKRVISSICCHCFQVLAVWVGIFIWRGYVADMVEKTNPHMALAENPKGGMPLERSGRGHYWKNF